MKKKIRLSTLVIIGMTLSLLLVSVSYTVITMRGIRQIGNFAVKIDEENLFNISTNLFLEITKRTGRRYAVYFENAEEITLILAEQIQNKSLSEDILKNVSILDKAKNLTRYKNSDFYVYSKKSELSAIYWGVNINNTIPNNIKQQINSLYSLEPLLKGFYKYSEDYFTSIWIHGKSDYMLIYPKLDLQYQNIKSNEIFHNNFDVFNNIPAHIDNPDNIKPIWLPPYKDITGIMISSVFTPVYDSHGNIQAVVGLDINLDRLINAMLKSRLAIENENSLKNELFHGFLFLVNADANILAYPKNKIDIFSLSSDNIDLTKQIIQCRLEDSKNPDLKKIIDEMVREEQGIEVVKLQNKKFFIAHSNLGNTGFDLGFIVSEDALLYSAKQTRTEISKTELSAIKNGLLISFFVLSISILFTLLFFRKFLFTPLEKLRRKVRKMGAGNFNIKFEENGLLEIAELGSAFNYLGSKLKVYIEDLKEEIITRKQIETEIRIAADIQRSILPKLESGFNKNEFSMAAKLSSAKEASGDFYDFFYLNKERIVLIIADVVGKGISAAFYMGMVKTLLKYICFQERESPSRALNRINKILSHDNSSLMFVTLFIAYYDIKTGKMLYANAGHLDAICIGKNGTYREFGKMKGIALGITDSIRYRTRKTIINKSDTVFLYTDGVVEAINPQNEEFGTERLKRLLLKSYELEPEEMAEKITGTVRIFEKEKRFDDITVMVLKRT